MPLGFRMNFLIPGGRQGEENLDRPLSNYDVIGIPTRNWSSSFFDCFQNMIPSCLLSFCCPCVMWSQIVVRAQIPLLISLKNSIHSCRGNSGFGVFIDYFVWSLIIALVLLFVLIFVPIKPRIVYYLVIIVLIGIAGGLVYLLGHTRTAFREK